MSGVSSIKATWGRVPTSGVLRLAVSLDHAGPMARSLADCSALLSVLAAGAGQPAFLGRPSECLGILPLEPRTSGKPLSGVTVGVTNRPQLARVSDDVGEVFELATAACARLGARIVAAPACADLAAGDLDAILLAEFAALHGGDLAQPSSYRPSIREFVAMSQSPVTATKYIDAQRRRAVVAAAWERWFAEHEVDVLVEPTTPTTAPERGSGYDAGHAGGEGDPLIRLTATWDVTGLPVAAVPGGLGSRSGLPVGISIVGRREAEAQVLQVGIDLQATALPPLGIVEPRQTPRLAAHGA